jgi:hypothetical protein
MNIRLAIAGILFTTLLSACFLQSADVPDVKQPRNHKARPVIQAQVAPPHDTIFITAVGDMMLGTSYPNINTLPPDSAIHSFDAALPYLQQADVTFGNLEGALLNDGEPAAYKKRFKSTPYLFRMPVAYAGVFKAAGFNVLSLANNHIDDFTKKGRLSTMQALDSLGINYGGLLAKPTAEFEKDGVKYGFCSFAPNSQTLALLDIKKAKAIISDLKSRCDVVIVSFHGGGEGLPYEHVPCGYEYYVGENRGDVHAFAHAAIDAGADVIFGNGPHVSRAMELYNNRLIAYSLGNFCTYRSVSVDGVCGLAALLQVKLNKKGELLNGQLIAFKQTHANGLVRDTLNRVISRIKYLTQTDFQLSGLNIAADGHITVSPSAPVVLAASGQ